MVYHGTDVSFEIFDKTKIKKGSSGGDGFYFTPNKEDARGYAGSQGVLYSCFLNITNPFIYVYCESFYNDTIVPINKEAQSLGITFEQYLQNNGYDGIIFKNYSKSDIYIAFEPNQIKSITNKRPTTHDNINEAVVEAYMQLSEDFSLEYGDYERPPYNDGDLQRAIDSNTPKEDYYGSVNLDAFFKGYPAGGVVWEDIENSYDYDGGESKSVWKRIKQFKDVHPDVPMQVKIYRIVPNSVKDTEIHNGDWITLSKGYAIEHGDLRYTADYHILTDITTTDKIWWYGEHICEFGLDDKPINWK